MPDLRADEGHKLEDVVLYEIAMGKVKMETIEMITAPASLKALLALLMIG